MDENLAGEAWNSGEPEAGAAADAAHGAKDHLPEARYQQVQAGGQSLYVPVGEDQGHPAQPGVGSGHHLPAHGSGVPLPGGDHGLAQPVRGVLAAARHPGSRLFGAEALEEALGKGQPEVFNTDQGSQFTSLEFTQVLQEHGVQISMDGKGRYSDNIFVERLWRTAKYEELHLKAYASVPEAQKGLETTSGSTTT